MNTEKILIDGAKAVSLCERKMNLKGMFKNKYKLSGKNWIQKLPKEDRRIFSEIGRIYNLHGHLGGVARAKTAKRDKKGRFI